MSITLRLNIYTFVLFLCCAFFSVQEIQGKIPVGKHFTFLSNFLCCSLRHEKDQVEWWLQSWFQKSLSQNINFFFKFLLLNSKKRTNNESRKFFATICDKKENPAGKLEVEPWKFSLFLSKLHGKNWKIRTIFQNDFSFYTA